MLRTELPPDATLTSALILILKVLPPQSQLESQLNPTLQQNMRVLARWNRHLQPKRVRQLSLLPTPQGKQWWTMEFWQSEPPTRGTGLGELQITLAARSTGAAAPGLQGDQRAVVAEDMMGAQVACAASQES